MDDGLPLDTQGMASGDIGAAGALELGHQTVQKELPKVASPQDYENVRHGTAYLETLTVYLREGCRNQACADAMSLHVTTLRYRLSRIAELFGVDVETPERRFALELAIRLHSVIDLVGK